MVLPWAIGLISCETWLTRARVKGSTGKDEGSNNLYANTHVTHVSVLRSLGLGLGLGLGAKGGRGGGGRKGLGAWPRGTLYPTGLQQPRLLGIGDL